MEKSYYIGEISCRTHNKKTEHLSSVVKRLQFSLVSFDGVSFTPESMLGYMKNIVDGANQQYRGREVVVRMEKFRGYICYIFKDDNNGECFCSVRLHPIDHYIEMEDDL